MIPFVRRKGNTIAIVARASSSEDRDVSLNRKLRELTDLKRKYHVPQHPSGSHHYELNKIRTSIILTFPSNNPVD